MFLPIQFLLAWAIITLMLCGTFFLVIWAFYREAKDAPGWEQHRRDDPVP